MSNTAFFNLTENLRDLYPKEDKDEYVAFMGNASHVVEAEGVNNVYVIRHDRSVSTVRNTRVPNVAGLQVIVGYSSEDPTLLQVLRQVNAYANPPYPPVKEHAEIMHRRWGYDPVFIENTQILAGLATPYETTGMVVSLLGFSYYLNGYHTLDNTTVDFSAEIPVSGACWVVAEIDSAKVITLRAGVNVASRDLLTPENIPAVASDKKSMFAVKCYYGQSRIVYTKTTQDIFDLRFVGVSSGGISTAVDWSDISNIPSEFPPDLDITDLYYVKRLYAAVDPDEFDDQSTGVTQTTIWINTVTSTAFLCLDNTNSAAVWMKLNSASGGVTGFSVQGHLAVVDGATSPILITSDMTLESWKGYIETLGTSGSTIFDIILLRVGDAPVSIFDDGVTDNRPVIQWDDTDSLMSATPLVTDFLAGDVLVLNIDQIAVGAANLILAAVSTGGGGSGGTGLTVTDGLITVENVGQITVEGAEVTDETGGEIKIIISPSFPDYSAGVSKSINTVYQAATDGWLNVVLIGSYMNDASVLIGPTSTPTTEIARAGDDINSYTKYASWMLPIPKDMYYKVVNGWESTTITWYPVG